MENKSSFERVVGNISEAQKEEVLRVEGTIFEDQKFEDMKGEEREKTPEEIQIISIANELTNEVRQKYGLKNFDIPPENIHIIKKESWPEELKSEAISYYPIPQRIILQESRAKVGFMNSIFHDMLHFKSYSALQVTKSENPEFKDYRVGLTITSRDGKKVHFTNLNEAVTEEMTERFSRRYFDNPLFVEELERTKDIMQRYPNVKKESGEPLFGNDTYYAEIQGTNIMTLVFTYGKEKEILNILIDKILEKNPGEFQDREEIFEVFAKGMMTGNILPAGRLVDETFGKGTLRKIGELDENIQEQEKFVSSL